MTGVEQIPEDNNNGNWRARIALTEAQPHNVTLTVDVARLNEVPLP